MRIWPAIDLKDGKCVRLSQGNYRREIVYGNDPADMAARWVSEGADGLHIIDLDGAIGHGNNLQAIEKIATDVDIDLQVGGGIRDYHKIETLLSLGIKRIIVSTKPLEDFSWLEKMAERFAFNLLVSVDTRNGKISCDGWRRSTSRQLVPYIDQLSQLPLAGLIYTNIDRAGMLNGPDIGTPTSIKKMTGLPLITSGGASSYQHLMELHSEGIDGCIIGKAIYEGRINLSDAIKDCESSMMNRRVPV
ncbi:MAG: 1-(5-phosphoribosyl)-5-[(5-phosphoribosylamino)methylideneamino]imidazole-4-carboxamide isomerase [Planctomycetota bacterium]